APGAGLRLRGLGGDRRRLRARAPGRGAARPARRAGRGGPRGGGGGRRGGGGGGEGGGDRGGGGGAPRGRGGRRRRRGAGARRGLQARGPAGMKRRPLFGQLRWRIVGAQMVVVVVGVVVVLAVTNLLVEAMLAAAVAGVGDQVQAAELARELSAAFRTRMLIAVGIGALGAI